MDVKILIFLLIASVYLRKTYGYSCEYNECNCVGEMITCIDIAAPRFKFRPSVTKLYMENVQIVDIKKMLHNLPNLKYVTLVNINYFKCGWLENFATNVVVAFLHLIHKLMHLYHFPKLVRWKPVNTNQWRM